MAVKKRRAGSNLSWNIEVKPEHWRDPCEEYVGQRQHNPVWRSKCRLPEGASLTDKRTIERYIEPQARLDLVSYVAGTGPIRGFHHQRRRRRSAPPISSPSGTRNGLPPETARDRSHRRIPTTRACDSHG